MEKFQADNLKHRSCWRHLAAYLHGVPGKVTEDDMINMLQTFKDISPCFYDKIVCRKRSKRSGRHLPKQRWKMDAFTFDDHLETIWRSLSEAKSTEFAQVGSICFSLYRRERSKGLNMIKKAKIFSKKFVFVPILCWYMLAKFPCFIINLFLPNSKFFYENNCWCILFLFCSRDHWRLVVFCHFGETSQSETKNRCILLLDSVQMGAENIVPEIRKFVYDIFKAEGRPEIKDAIYRIPLLVPKVPQQRNDVDCGRFVLYFIKQFIDAAPENFSISNGFSCLMEKWFDSDKFEEFCDILEKELPTSTRGKGVVRRYSQRITKKCAVPRKSSRQGAEVISID